MLICSLLTKLTLLQVVHCADPATRQHGGEDCKLLQLRGRNPHLSFAVCPNKFAGQNIHREKDCQDIIKVSFFTRFYASKKIVGPLNPMTSACVRGHWFCRFLTLSFFFPRKTYLVQCITTRNISLRKYSMRSRPFLVMTHAPHKLTLHSLFNRLKERL